MTRSRGVRRRRGEAWEYFCSNLWLPASSGGCKLWPYNHDKDGYGYVWINGARRYSRVSVLACEATWGPMPEPGMVAAHGRDERCVSVSCWEGVHLGWKTHKENAADRRRDGTKDDGGLNPRAKLTEADVLAIRAAWAAGNGRNQSLLAQTYGVAPQTISKIVTRAGWNHI
jgi:hypothetical protein